MFFFLGVLHVFSFTANSIGLMVPWALVFMQTLVDIFGRYLTCIDLISYLSIFDTGNKKAYDFGICLYIQYIFSLLSTDKGDGK